MMDGTHRIGRARASLSGLSAATLLALAAAPGVAQIPERIDMDEPHAVAGWTTVEAGPSYDAGELQEWLLGEGYRELWLEPVRVPILDLDAYAPGLEPVEQGGGNQSITLHFEAADGREYIFRSVDKHIQGALPSDLVGTPVGTAMQDVTSALYPASALAVARLLDATDILHVHPRLYVMPDDPRLGEFRETFAGMLGMMELTPNETEDDEPLFANSPKIKGTEEFMNDIEDSPEHQLNAQRFVKARLFDFFVNDPDRAEDQWRWAEYPGEDGSRWEPIPRDRDWAFVDAGGFGVRMAGKYYPKLVPFTEEYPEIESLTFESWAQDRRLLAELEWQDWQRAARELQTELSDEVIASALEWLPPEYGDMTREQVGRVLRARRDNLRSAAREYYQMLAAEADIHATDVDERADVTRRPNGDVIVRVAAEDADEPYYERHFLESETQEIRLDMHGGADSVIVHGDAGHEAIVVRVMGGGGDDTLINTGRTAAWQQRTLFYDDRGENRFRAEPGTWIDTGGYDEPDAPDNWLIDRTSKTVADWGGSQGFSPSIGYGEAAGVILGAGYSYTRYGFRADPYRYRIRGGVMYATRSNSFGVEMGVSTRVPSTHLRLDVNARAVEYDGFRFYGFGNETPVPEDHVDRTLVEQDRIEASVSAVWQRDALQFGAGPLLRYTDPRAHQAAPLNELDPPGSQPLGRMGAQLWGALDRAPDVPGEGGYRAGVGLTAFPQVWDVAEAYAPLEGEAAAYIPLPLGQPRPTIALRIGARHVLGDCFPVQDAAFVGGSATVRGYRFNRFAGRTAAWGNGELRFALFEMELLTRGRLGALALADAGRVWLDDEDSERWHDAFGGGLWWETVGFAVSGVYAHGEEDRFYLNFGMPF